MRRLASAVASASAGTRASTPTSTSIVSGVTETFPTPLTLTTSSASYSGVTRTLTQPPGRAARRSSATDAFRSTVTSYDTASGRVTGT